MTATQPSLRVAFGGIHVECSTYNPVLIRAQDFQVMRGAEMLDSPYFGFLGDYDATFLPLVHARAVPGGPIARATYDALKQEFLDGLRALGPVDGLYLAMHGAMFVEGMEDAEGDWITAARDVVGDGCIVTASYDLHGNVTQRILDALDLFSTYRTAPHIDVEETMRRSVAMLMRALATGERPSLVWAPVPVLLPGERTSTVDEPARGLYARLPGMDALPGVWDASLQVGYVWADEPRSTAAVIMTGTDVGILTEAAASLAQAYWDAREAFVFGCEVGTIADCVTRARLSETGPAVIADSGDNPTGGGVGDRADVLRDLVAQDCQGVIVAAITDALAVEIAFAAGEGARVTLNIGGTLDPASMPVALDVEILRLHVGPASKGREAVVVHRGLTIVLAERRRPYHDIADFRRLGLNPLTAAIVVVKSGYLSPDLAPIANPSLMALSEGVVNQDVERLVRLRTTTRTFPFERDFSFVPQVLPTTRRGD